MASCPALALASLLTRTDEASRFSSYHADQQLFSRLHIVWPACLPGVHVCVVCVCWPGVPSSGVLLAWPAVSEHYW